MITLDKVDFSGIDQKIREITRITKEEPAKLIRQEARLLCVELSKYTQPFGLDDKAKQQGESAIKGDLLGGSRGDWDGVKRAGIFYVLPDALTALSRHEKAGLIRIFARKDGSVFGTDGFRYKVQSSISELEQLHHDAKKDGRVSSEAGARTLDIGRWKFVNRFVITKSQFNALLKILIAKVGFAKGGWATCAAQLGGTRGIPAWVTKHKTPGTVIDDTGSENPKITIRNDVNYTSQVLSDSNLKGALRDREIKLTERIRKILASKFRGIR